jgi:enoyl-CoA hydratase
VLAALAEIFPASGDHMKNWNLELHDGIAVVKYAELEPALSFAIMTELADLLESFAGSARHTSVVLLTGGDAQYLPDADHDELQRLTPVWEQPAPEPIVGDVFAWHRVTTALVSLPQPTVAAIDGSAVGGACLVALACTFRLASERATVGPVLFDMGVLGTESSRYIVPLVGPAVAAELLMTGRSLQASEAKQVGLLNEVFQTADFSDHVREWCQRIAKNPPGLTQAIKRDVARSAGTFGVERPPLDPWTWPKSGLQGGCGC